MNQYYEALGLDPNKQYTEKELKSAYKARARESHPDLGGDQEQFKKITEAYEILTGKRRPANQPPPDINPDEFFGNFGGGFGFDFGDLFHNLGRQPKRHQRPPPPDQLVLQLQVSLKDIEGKKVYGVQYEVAKDCEKCNGVGGKSSSKCLLCDGKGRTTQTKQSGSGTYFSVHPCMSCSGYGIIIQEPCTECGSKGFKTSLETLKFKVEKV